MAEASTVVYANGNESILDISDKYTGDSRNAEFLIDFNGLKNNLIDFLPSGEWVAIPNRLLSSQPGTLTVTVTGSGSKAPNIPITLKKDNTLLYAILGIAAIAVLSLTASSNKKPPKRRRKVK